MGPLWDFDGAFGFIDDWSAIHNRTYSFYFTKLLERQDFYTCYVNLWQTLRKSLREDISHKLIAVDSEKGEDINASRKLDTKRWEENTTPQPLSAYISETNNWLDSRIRWIDDQLLTRYQLQFVIDGETFHTDSLIFRERIIYPPVPNKVGYIFSGWDQMPDIMPAENLTINATFIPSTIYDLKGRRYHPQQLSKGIYIIDGKKVIIRH